MSLEIVDIEVVGTSLTSILIDHFMKTKPFTVNWRKSEGNGYGWLSVLVRQIVGPSPTNPGRFTLICEVRSPGMEGTLEMNFDSESKFVLPKATKFIPAPIEAGLQPC